MTTLYALAGLVLWFVLPERWALVDDDQRPPFDQETDDGR